MKLKSILPTATLSALLAGAALAAPDIRVQGRQTSIWNTIDDGDHNPDQAVTDFGTVDFGDGKSRAYRIQNRGNDDLVVNSIQISSADYVLTGIALPVTVAKNDHVRFDINYVPTRAASNAIVSVASNSPGAESNYTFAITGNGEGPEIELAGRPTAAAAWDNIVNGDGTPSAAEGSDLGNVAVGESRTREFRIRNGGTATLQINGRGFSGSRAGDWDVDRLFAGHPTIGQLAPGAERVFEITWAPSQPGPTQVTFSVRTNDGDEDPFTFDLKGNATADPDIRVQGREAGFWNVIADGDRNAGDQAVTDFGSPNDGTATRAFRVQNEGAATLTVTSISSSNPAFTIDKATPFQVAAGAAENFEVDFGAQRAGTAGTMITIASNDPDAESSYTFALTAIADLPEASVHGRDLSPGAPYLIVPEGDATPSPNDGTDFGEQAANPVFGGGTTRQFRLYNTGERGLDVAAVYFTGHVDDFGAGNLDRHTPLLPIAPGDYHPFTLTFAPRSAGEKTATVHVVSNAINGSFQFDLRGIGVAAPRLELRGRNGSLDALDFLDVFDTYDWTEIHNGDTTPRDRDGTDFDRRNINGGGNTNPFRILNYGSADLVVHQVLSDSQAYTFSDLPTGPVAPFEDHVFRVTFDPEQPGRHDATVRIISNAGNFVFAVTGFGTGKGGDEPGISIEGRDGALAWQVLSSGAAASAPNGTQFGTAGVGAVGETHLFRVTNTGDATLVMVEVEPVGDFLVEGLPGELEPGERETFEVTFAPGAVGQIDRLLRIGSNAADDGEFLVNLRGQGEPADGSGGPEITVRGWGLEIGDGASSANLADGSDFGTGSVGVAIRRDFWIHNDGDAPLAVSAITCSDARFVVSAPPSSVAPGEAERFELTYTPTSTARRQAVVTIANNDPDGGESSYTFTVAGRAVAAPPQAAIDLSAAAFGGVEIGDTASRLFTVENTGGSELLLAGAASDDPQFAIDDLHGTLAPGESRSFGIAFTPAAAGAQAAEIAIYTNAADAAPLTVAVSGTGLVDDGPALAITAFSRAADEVQIAFQSQVGESYRIAWSDGGGTWYPAPGHEALAGDGRVIARTVRDSEMPAAAGGKARLFRVEEE